MLSTTKYADLQIVWNPLLTKEFGLDVGAYTPRVPKRVAATPQEVPLWRHRLALAVKPHGRLAEIAKAARMTSPQLQKIVNGTTKDPGIGMVERLATAMNMTLVELIEPRPESEPGHEHRVGGTSVLERLVAEASTEDGSVESDIARAIAILTGALERRYTRDASDRKTETPRRGTASDR